MRILYIANHDQTNSADDEGAITYTLRQLGHEVAPVHERETRRIIQVSQEKFWKPDLLLFHKWAETELMSLFRGKCPLVFWYFDLVEWPSDPTLRGRCDQRKEWMRRVLPLVDVGFCTDGDWVASENKRYCDVKSIGWTGDWINAPGKLVWLTQGADERVVGINRLRSNTPEVPILFTGISRGGGLRRESFVQCLKEQYRERFRHVPRGIYGRELATLISGTRVFVCPDSPVTDRYWSNRIFNCLGFGAFTLHQWSKGLSQMFEHGKHVVYYHDRHDLFDKIDYYLSGSKVVEQERQDCAERGMEEVKLKHLYRHRVSELLRVVKERLGV